MRALLASFFVAVTLSFSSLAFSSLAFSSLAFSSLAFSSLAFSSLAFSSLAFSSLAGLAAEPEKLALKLPGEHIKFFALTYSSETDVVGSVRCNDVPITKLDGKGSSGSSREVQTWLIPGTNRIDITFTKLPSVPNNDAQALVTLALHGLPQPAMPDDTNALLQLAIRKDKAKVGTTLSYTFELPATQAPPGTIWKVAAVNTALSDLDIKQIDALAADILRAMQRGDAAALKKRMAFMLDVQTAATGMDKKEMASMIEGALPEMKKSLAKTKLASPLEHQLWAGGRIVAVTTKDGKAPISAFGANGEGASVDIHAVKIDGQWTLCP